MKKLMIMAGLLAAAAGAGAAVTFATGQDEPEGSTAGLEHAFLKEMEGVWDVQGKWWTTPGAAPTESKGVERATMSLNGFWLLVDYQGEMAGSKIQGHGFQGYDPVRKKYVAHWMDSADPMLRRAEGEMDKTGKVLTMNLEGRDPATGKATKDRWVTEYKDRDSYKVTLSRQSAAGGSYVKVGEVTYKRRK